MYECILLAVQQGYVDMTQAYMRERKLKYLNRNHPNKVWFMKVL